jgi:predicted nucleic acid-binding protein
MIVLDTNVISELMRAAPETAVIDWIDAHADIDLFVTAITVAELHYGIARLPEGRRKTNLAIHVERMIEEDFDHRVLPFDEAAAAHYGDIAATREHGGRPISGADAQIAAICRSYGSTLATRNVNDFTNTGITVVDPWSSDQS